MARTNNLTDFLTDVATAIKNKKGDNSKILASEFDNEISNLPSGGSDEELETSFANLLDNSLGANVTKLPSNLTSIRDYVFYNCTELALKNLPSNLKTIGSYAFYYCSNLSLTELPETVTSIKSYAFSNCDNLALTKLPDGLTELGIRAFEYCRNLAIKEIPSGVTSFTAYMFRDCDKITELTIKGDNISFTNNTFYSCSYLAKIVFPNVTSVPSLGNVNVFTSTPIASGTGYIYVPDTLVESFKSASNWSSFADQIKPISELEVV